MNKFFRIFSSPFPFKLLQCACNIKSIFPFYHVVSDNPPKHVKQLYTIKNTNQFKKDLDFYLKYYQPVDLQEVIESVTENTIFKKNIFHITFDDGLSEIYNLAAPILKEKGIPATFFVNSAFIDNKDLFYRYKISMLVDTLKTQKPGQRLLDEISALLKNGLQVKNTIESIIQNIFSISYQDKNALDQVADVLKIDFHEFLKREKPYLSSDQINLLIHDGFTIGAHSIDHPPFAKISTKEQLRQTAESIGFMTQTFNLPYRVFSFPFTDNGVNAAFFEHIFQSNTADVTFGTAGIKKDKAEKNLQRIPVEKSNIGANKYIRSEYFYYLLKTFIGQNKINRT